MSLAMILLFREAEAMKTQGIVKGKPVKVYLPEGNDLIVDFSTIQKHSARVEGSKRSALPPPLCSESFPRTSP